MYGPSYAFNPASNAPYNPQNPPGQHQNQHQQQHQHQQPHLQLQQQQQMYNPQHSFGGSQGHQSPYNAPAGMGGGNGGMQNTGLAHPSGGGGAAGHVGSPYQTPYTSSPYGVGIPTSTATTLSPQQYLPNSSGAPAFQMTMPSMQQRMQPPTSSTPQPRASPYGIAPQGTPPNAATQQSQFSTPQPQSSNPALQQTPNQQQSGGIITPQTPNFPPGAQGTGGLGSQIATPLSPGSEAREKERVSLLLEINGELLRASIRIQSVQKEITANTASSPDAATAGEKEVVDKEKAEKDKAQNHKDWNEYMRRLQCNLAYLAAIADRSHKPSSQIPPHPGIMSAPPTRKPNSPSTGSPVNADVKSDHGEGDEERDTTLKELYERLQALFPGVDPKKDPQAQAVKKTQQVPAGDQNQAMLKAQMQQRMVQEQQAKQQQQLQQQQAQAQAQAQAMAGRS